MARAAQSHNDTILIISLGLAIACLGVFLHYPLIFALPVSVAVAALAYTPPPTPRTRAQAETARRIEAEAARMKRLAVRAALPGPHWLPGWANTYFITAVGMALIASALVVGSSGARVFNAVSMAAFVFGVAWYGRAQKDTELQAPATSVRHAIEAASWVIVVVALAAGASLWWVWQAFVIEQIPAAVGDYFSYRDSAVGVGLAVIGAGAIIHASGVFQARRDFNQKVSTRQQWRSGWQMVVGKDQGLPSLVRSRSVGPFEEHTFVAAESSSNSGPQAVVKFADKIALALPASAKVWLAAAQATDDKGAALPGVMSQTQFRVVTCEQELPRLTDASTPLEVVQLTLDCVLNQAALAGGESDTPLMVANIQPVHPQAPGKAKSSLKELFTRSAPPEPTESAVTDAAWIVQVSGEFFSLSSTAATASGEIGTDVFYDDGRIGADDLAGTLIVGQPTVEMIDTSGPFAAAMASFGSSVGLDGEDLQACLGEYQRRREIIDQWDLVWSNVTVGEINSANIPTLQWAVEREASYLGRPISQMAFMPNQGTEINKVVCAKAEQTLTGTLGAAAFTSVTHFLVGASRHPQGFEVRWSVQPLPTRPEQVAPITSTERSEVMGRVWIFKRILDLAFDQVRLARPEVVSARCLTQPTSREHVWLLTVDLYGSATAAEVRSKAAKLASAMAGTESVMVEASAKNPSRIRMVVGAAYTSAAVLLSEDAPLDLLANLAWQQTFYSAKITAPSGDLPTVLTSEFLPHNNSIEKLTLQLPAGLTLQSVQARSAKIAGSTGNAFTVVEPVKDRPDQMVILSAPQDPMPFPAPPNWSFLDHNPGLLVPFATRIDGSVAAWNPASDPHLMIVGGTGSGKSVTADYILASALAQGFMACLIDPQKGGADFEMLSPWLSATAFDIFSALALIETIYEEVERRRDLNAEHGAQSIADLPEDIRPARLVLFIDEFTSLINAGKAPAKPRAQDHRVQREYEQAMAERDAKIKIGMLVGKIGMEARSAGVHAVVAGQKINAEVLKPIPGGSVLRTNMARLMVGKATTADKQAALREPFNAPDLGEAPPSGRGIFEPMSDAAMLIQTWYEHPPADTIPAMLSPRIGDSAIATIDYSDKMVEAKPQFEGDVIEESSEPVDLGEIDLFGDFDPPAQSSGAATDALFDAMNDDFGFLFKESEPDDGRGRGTFDPFA